MEINGAITLTVGTTAVSLTNSGSLAAGGRFPRGLVLVCPSTNAGTCHLRHDGEATTDYPPIPIGEFSSGLPVGVEALVTPGVSVIASQANQKIHVYPL